MAESREEAAKGKEALLEGGLTQEQYDSVMRRRVHDAWMNQVITDRGLRSNYFEWIKMIFFLQLVATNLILFVCAVFGHAAPAIVAGCLTGVTGLVAAVTKYMFSAESTEMINALTKVVNREKTEPKG